MCSISQEIPFSHQFLSPVLFAFLQNAYACTGFLVSSTGLFLTDSDCILNQNEASQSLITFGAEVDCLSDGTDDCVLCGGGYSVSGATEVYRDEGLGILLLHLSGNPALLAPFGYLDISETDAQLDDEVYAVHYPQATTSTISSEVGFSFYFFYYYYYATVCLFII